MDLEDDFVVFPEDVTNVNGLGSSHLSTPIQNPMIVEPPVVGMQFQTVEDGEEYYKQYGRTMGFDTKRRSTDRRERGSNRITSCLVVCGREGNHEKVSECDPSKRRNTSTGRCDCKAGMRFTLRPLGYYEVTTIVLEHNHDPVTPSKMIKMKGNKCFPEAAKDLTKRFAEEGLPVGKVAAVFGGSTIGFSKKDCQNHFGKTRKNPKKGDATAVFNYFQRKSEEDSQFFYAIQTDDEARAVNFFWVDGRSRMQYDLFGDVVVFDTTYKTNSYSMPFAPFTGVNHHSQTIQFGCALLLDEIEETFVWLFKTWLAAMGGRPPISVLTDQDRAMTAAVARVFPSSRHRYCLWHVTKKIPEKFCQVIKKNASFHDELKLIISCSYKIEDFEAAWKDHFLKYNLEGHEWVIEQYETRSKWVPAFHLDTFYAGMNTTGRGESMNSMYDAFVDHNTNLIDFVIGSDRLIDGIAFVENEFDFRVEHRTALVAENGSYLLKHASKWYTKRIFLKFQDQFKKAMTTYRIDKEEVGDNGYTSYTLRSRNSENPNYWIVNFNVMTQEGKCECRYFEFMGLLCGHILKVLVRHDIDLIPERYILRRWRIRANTYRSMFNYDGSRVTGRDDYGKLQSTHLNRVATELVAHCSHTDDYKYALQKFNEMFLEVDQHIEARKVQGEDTIPDVVMDEAPSVDPTQILLLNPNISQTKGRPKQPVRFRRGSEPTTTSNSAPVPDSQEVHKRGCVRCRNAGREFEGHDWRTCTLNPGSKKNRFQL